MKFIFDEKNPIWLNIYKVLNVIYLACMAFLALFGSFDDLLDLDYIFFHEDSFILWFIVCAVIGFSVYALNMLLIQLFSNVNAIREKIEKQ